MLIQEAEDQDICAVSGGALVCGAPTTPTASRTRCRSWRWPSPRPAAAAYDAAYDRDGADARGIVSAFLFRTDRVTLAPADRGRPGARRDAGRRLPRRAGLAYNADVQNPKSLNAELPADVDTLHRRGRRQRLHPGAAGGPVPGRRRPGGPRRLTTCGRSATTSRPTPDAPGGPAHRAGRLRRGHRRRRSRRPTRTPGSSSAATSTCSRARTTRSPPRRPAFPSDQLAPLYEAGLHNLWDDLVADVPSAAYSYIVPGPGADAGPLFVNDALYGDLVQMRAAHVNAGWPADYPGDGPRGLSDHDPQVARGSPTRPSRACTRWSTTTSATGALPANKAFLFHDRLDKAQATCRAGQDRHRPVTAQGVRQPGARLRTGRRGRCHGQGGNPPGGPARPTSTVRHALRVRTSPSGPRGSSRPRRRSARRRSPSAASDATVRGPDPSERRRAGASPRPSSVVTDQRPATNPSTEERRQEVPVLLGHGRAMGGRQDRARARSYEMRTLSQRDRKRTGAARSSRGTDASARSSSSRPSSPSRGPQPITEALDGRPQRRRPGAAPSHLPMSASDAGPYAPR